MKLRQLTWDDVQVRTGHRNRNGELRVHFSLKNASFICKTAWLDDWRDDRLQRAVALLELNRRGSSLLKRLAPYTET